MTVELRKVREGDVLTVAAVVRDACCSFEDTVERIGRSNPKAQRRLMAMLDVAAQLGLDALDNTKLRPLGEGLFEFKEHSAGIRLFWFFDKHRRRLIIVHRVWIKAGKDNRQPLEIKKARKEMAELTDAGLLPFESMETGT